MHFMNSFFFLFVGVFLFFGICLLAIILRWGSNNVQSHWNEKCERELREIGERDSGFSWGISVWNFQLKLPHFFLFTSSTFSAIIEFKRTQRHSSLSLLLFFSNEISFNSYSVSSNDETLLIVCNFSSLPALKHDTNSNAFLPLNDTHSVRNEQQNRKHFVYERKNEWFVKKRAVHCFEFDLFFFFHFPFFPRCPKYNFKMAFKRGFGAPRHHSHLQNILNKRIEISSIKLHFVVEKRQFFTRFSFLFCYYCCSSSSVQKEIRFFSLSFTRPIFLWLSVLLAPSVWIYEIHFGRT